MDDFAKQTDSYGELSASGFDVGLNDGLMGNSEVGHLNIGAGRVVWQDIVRIDKSILDGKFASNETLVKAFRAAKEGTGRIHFLGLVSDGGVHSHIDHLKALLEAAKAQNVPEAYLHYFGDGRDTPPQSGVNYVEDINNFLEKLEYGQLATLLGRYYAMDRDKRWERVHVAYKGIFHGEGEEITKENLIEGIKKRYANGENDEFLKPFIINKKGIVQPNDVLLCFDFRSDRMRQMGETLVLDGGMFEEPNVDKEKEKALLSTLKVFTMTQYKKDFPFPVLFPQLSMDNVLAEHLSKLGVKQFHTAETEKYAHVTFFFNGGVEKQFEGEDRKLISSPKVATYDLKPEMSVIEVGNELADVIEKNDDKTGYGFLMCNFAPPDMVGHTGSYEETVKACEFTDHAISRVKEACKKKNTILFITADHGNAEKMIDDKGGKVTSHTTNLVPFILYDPSSALTFKRKLGSLADVAPTVLDAMVCLLLLR
eukprot:TRINITY_DN8069_c0_g1_i1.p1 TRINITY_DN8069_c0_g1~~TRINITY_DN8069_c0_g1_i1.p1  ORF type:complete len:534 (-),score=148.06 TRINITY_DN8069_c0_g1_i1:86-1531(-)